MPKTDSLLLDPLEDNLEDPLKGQLRFEVLEQQLPEDRNSRLLYMLLMTVVVHLSYQSC